METIPQIGVQGLAWKRIEGYLLTRWVYNRMYELIVVY